MYDIDVVEKYELNLRNGKKLKDFRLDNHIKVSSLAKSLGIGKSSIYHYEKGERPIPDKLVDLLNNLYMLDLEFTGNRPLIPIFNQKLKQIRLVDDISQVDFARVLNVRTDFIKEIESGKKDLQLPVDFIQRLQKCGYDLNWLFNEVLDDKQQ